MGNVDTERIRVSSGSPFEATIGFSRAVRVGERVIVSGTAPIWPDGSCDPDPAMQMRRCLEIIIAALREAGAEPSDVVRTRVYLVDGADAAAIGAVHGEVFGTIRPASTMIIAGGLLDPRWRVEVEAEAVVARDAADIEWRSRELGHPLVDLESKEAVQSILDERA